MGANDPQPRNEERQAAAWLLRIDEGLTEAEVSAFAAWVEASAGRAELLAKQAAVLAAAPAAFAIAEAPPPRRGAFVPAVAAAMAGLAAIVFALFLVPGMFAHRPTEIALATGVGEVSIQTLPDRSRLWIDAHTQVIAAFQPRERQLRLERGRIYVEVAPDPGRPFVIRAKTFTATAVGTAFESVVFERYSRVQVSEGHVRVTQGGREVVLAAGEAMRIDASGAMRREAAGTVGGWRVFRLEFRSTPLVEALAEINRYRRHPIAVSDRTLAAAPISGVFPVGALDEAKTANLLAAALETEVAVREGGATILLAPKAH